MEIYDSNSYGKMKVVEHLGDAEVLVEFLNTGFRRKANIHNVRAGKVRDTSVKYQSPVEVINEIWPSNSHGDFLVIHKQGDKVLIRFLDTDYMKEVYLENARKGKVSDPYRVTVYGKGIIGDFDKSSHPYWKQAKQLWRNMMKRCYSEKDLRGYFGKGVSVDKRWLTFANFLEDLPQLDNFQMWLDGHKEGNPKYNLDKDLKVEGNKVYSKHTCGFVSEFDNKSAGGKNRMRDLPNPMSKS